MSGALVGTTGQMYDASTGHGAAAHPRTPFANNQIPFSRVNPVSLAILQGMNAAAAKYGTLNTKPLSNRANDYTTNLPFTKTTDSFDTKIDFAPTSKDYLGATAFSVLSPFSRPALDHFSVALREEVLKVPGIRGLTVPA